MKPAPLKSGVIALALLLATAMAGRAGSVTVVLPQAQAAAGADLEVTVQAREAQGMGPMQLDLRYDPAVLEFANATAGDSPSIGLFDFNLLEPGNLRLAMTGNPGQPLEGEADLFRVTFQVIGGSGQQSPLNADNVRAWEQTEDSFDMIVEVEPGLVLVRGGVSVVLLAGAALATIILVVAALYIMRKLRRA